MAAIFIKVGALLLKTLAKPLSNRFQVYVMAHPTARQITINAAQRLHRFEVILARGAEGKTGRAFVGDMTEEKCLELGSKLASETFVFFVGVVIIAFEYERQRKKDIAKKSQEAAERQAILDGAKEERERLAQENRDQQELIHKLMFRVDHLEEMLHEMEHAAQQKAAASASNRWLMGGFFGPKVIS